MRPKLTQNKATVTQSMVVCPLVCLGIDTPSGHQNFGESSTSIALQFQGNNALKPEVPTLGMLY